MKTENGKWKTVKLGDIFDLQMGKTPDRKKIDYFQGSHKWISIADISKSEKYISETKEYLTDEAIASSGIKSIPKDTLIMSFKLSIGKTAITSDEMYSNEAIMAFLSNGKYETDNSFLYHLFSNKDWSEGSNKSVKGITLNKASLSEAKISLPPLETQKHIAAVLDKCTALIAKHREMLAKYDTLIKSRFIEMFGDPLDNQKNWEVQTLGNLCEIVRGGSPRPIDKFLGGSIPWIKIGDATNGDDIYLYKTKEHIIEEGIKKSRLIPEGSLIFANCGVSLGFARIIKFQGCIHDGWLAFQNISPRVNNVFLLKSLNMCTDYFRKTAPDGTQPNLNTTIMKSFVQILPPKDLQDEYVQFVQQIDKSKFAVQKSLEKAETLYKSLMQEYFG